MLFRLPPADRHRTGPVAAPRRPSCSQRPAIVATPHVRRWDDQLDDYDHTCTCTLRHQWRSQVIDASAHVLRPGSDGGGPRLFADDEALHADTPLDVLAADGTRLGGPYDTHTRQPFPFPATWWAAASLTA